MANRFSQIKGLIWDFDGTFYKPNAALWQDVRQAEYQTIMNHTGWSKKKTVIEFEDTHKHKFGSATQVAAFLSRISIVEAAVEMENYFDRRKYVQRDEKLIALFAKLKNFRHFTLANGVIEKHKQTLAVLGINPEIFEEMVTSETVGVTKPNPKGFEYILDKTKLAPSAHLMIGDREAIDLVPAKQLGMKTCLVWSDEKSEIADATLSSVYEVSSLFLQNPQNPGM